MTLMHRWMELLMDGLLDGHMNKCSLYMER